MMGGFGGCCGIGWFGNLGSFGWIGIALNLLVLITFVVGLVLLIAWVLRRVRSSASGDISQNLSEFPQTSANEVLAIRYARGDISQEEYKRISSDLA
jgi:uncharacterized membrane protein